MDYQYLNIDNINSNYNTDEKDFPLDIVHENTLAEKGDNDNKVEIQNHDFKLNEVVKFGAFDCSVCSVNNFSVQQQANGWSEHAATSQKTASVGIDKHDFKLDEIEIKTENLDYWSICSGDNLPIQQQANKQAATSQKTARPTREDASSSDMICDPNSIKQESIKLEDFDSSGNNVCEYDTERKDFCFKSEEIEIDYHQCSTDLNAEPTRKDTSSSDVFSAIDSSKQEAIKLEDFDGRGNKVCEYDTQRKNLCFVSKEIEIDSHQCSKDLNTELTRKDTSSSNVFLEIVPLIQESIKFKDVDNSGNIVCEYNTESKKIEIDCHQCSEDLSTEDISGNIFISRKTGNELKPRYAEINRSETQQQQNEMCEIQTAAEFNFKIDLVYKNLKRCHYQFCNYKTLLEKNLKNHILKSHIDRTHIKKIKHFSCHLCVSFKTKRKYALKRHVEAVHNSKIKFYCYLCEFNTVYRFNLNKHLDEVHNDSNKKNDSIFSNYKKKIEVEHCFTYILN